MDCVEVCVWKCEAGGGVIKEMEGSKSKAFRQSKDGDWLDFFFVYGARN